MRKWHGVGLATMLPYNRRTAEQRCHRFGIRYPGSTMFSPPYIFGYWRRRPHGCHAVIGVRGYCGPGRTFLRPDRQQLCCAHFTRPRNSRDWRPFYVDAASAGAILCGAGRSLGRFGLDQGCGNGAGRLLRAGVPFCFWSYGLRRLLGAECRPVLASACRRSNLRARRYRSRPQSRAPS